MKISRYLNRQRKSQRTISNAARIESVKILNDASQRDTKINGLNLNGIVEIHKQRDENNAEPPSRRKRTEKVHRRK